MRFYVYAVLTITATWMAMGCGATDIPTDLECSAGLNDCDSTCVNLQEDPLNCGACGTACADDEVCSAGVCELNCETGLDVCNDTCVDLQTDEANCGACGNTCAAGQPCADGLCQTWHALTGINGYGFADFIPAGQDPLVATNADIFSYSVIGDTWSNPFTGLSLPGGYSYPAWDGDKLYWLDNSDVFTLTIATGVTTQNPVPTMPISDDAQNTADEAHNVYIVADNGTIVQYNTTSGNLNTFTGPTDVPGDGDETRVAWDSKTQKVYLGDYNDTPFYSFDPATGTLTPLPAFPDAGGFNDAFCSDRNGFIYTTDDSGANGLLWVFDAVAGEWNSSALPFVVGSSGTCTVSGDGVLYLMGDGTMYGLKVF